MAKQILCPNPQCLQSLALPEELQGKQMQCPRCGTLLHAPPEDGADASGSVRLGHYTLVRKLGEGSMGEVFEAIQDGLNRRVALKILSPRVATDPTYFKRFQREAQAAAALNHRHIVSAYEIGQDQGRYFFSMELVDGETLKARLVREKKIPPHDALRYLVQSARGLAHAWEHQIVHRDLKPSNLMVTRDNTLKIADLGLAKFVATVGDSTPTDIIIGTPYYMSPEQARNEELDIRTDIYSLGATFYHLLSGELPFKGKSPFETIIKVSTEPFRPLREIQAEVPPAFATVVEKMMARNPENRYQSPMELLEVLDQVRARWPGQPGPAGEKIARPDTVGVPPVRAPAPAASAAVSGQAASTRRNRAVELKSRRNRTLLVAIGILCAILLAFALLSL